MVLFLGLGCMVAAPVLLATSEYSLRETSELGNTVGGITAPISSLVGSILVFLALKGQVLANKKTQEQIREQQLEEQRKKEVTYVADLYKHFVNSVQTFETKYYKGHRAIMRVMSVLANAERKHAHDERRLYYGIAAELYSLLNLGKLFLEQVNKCRLEQHDKRYFKELVKHHYDSFILPYLAKASTKPNCSICGETHNGIPFKILTVIKETIVLF